MKALLMATVAAGLAAIAAPARAQVINPQTGASYTVANADCDPQGRRLITFSNSAGVAVTIPQAGLNGQFLSGCIIKMQNVGGGNVTITPTTSQINGATSYTLVPGAGFDIVADATPTTTGNYWVAAGAVPPGATGRQQLRTMPAYYTLEDYGAAAIGNAKRRPAGITIANGSPNLQIETTYAINVSSLVCTASSTTITITPGVFPDSANANNTKRGRFPGCGAAGADLNADITSITSAGDTQTIVVGTVASTTTPEGTEAVVVIGPQDMMPAGSAATTRRLTYNVAAYRPISFVAGTPEVTAAAGTFADFDYTQPTLWGNYIADVAIPNAKGANCTETLLTRVTSVDATGATLTLAQAPTCSAVNVTRWLTWGQAVFGPDDVGKSLQLLAGGSAGGSALITTISSVTDASHVVLANNNVSTKTRIQTELTWGTDATSAWTAMTAAAVAAGYQYIYVPPEKGYFLATGTYDTITQYGSQLVWCGEGDVFLPQNQTVARSVTRSCTSSNMPPFADGTIIPNVHLRTSADTVTTLKVAFLGDSQMQSNYNAIGRWNMPNYICEAITKANPLRAVDCQNFAIGGTVWAEFDPAGPDFGNGAGIPSGDTATFPAWYTPTSNQWYTFVMAYCPRVVVMKWGYNDGYELNWGSIQSIMDLFQGATWLSSCGFNPDLIIATEGPPGAADDTGQTSFQGKDYAMAYLRSWALSGEYSLANGGKIGLLDIGRARKFANYGWHDEFLPAERATYIVPPSNANDGMQISANTYTWPAPVYDYQVAINGFRVSALNVADWWAAVQTVDFSLGNGASGTPWDSGTQTGAEIPFSGGRVRLAYTGGNYSIQVRTFDVTSAATVSVATTTVTCAAACTNMGFKNATIEIPGAGVAGGTYTGTITAVNAAGTSITITPAVSTALVSKARTLRFYHDQIPTTDTGVTARCDAVSTVCDSAFTFALKGSNVALYDNNCFQCSPIWQGRVVKFGGYFLPTITVGGTFSRYLLTTVNDNNLSAAMQGRPDNGTFYSIAGNDVLTWGIQGSSPRWGGGGYNHPSTLGDQWVVPVVVNAQNWNINFLPTSAAVNTPVNGFTYTTGPQQVSTQFTPAGTLATGTIVLPRNVPQGSLITYNTTQEITALTVSAPSGYTISGTAATTMPANSALYYRLQGAVFYREIP